MGISLIAEGIETRSELETVRSLGVHFGQGYFLGRPAADPIVPLGIRG
jgi:EAL domain-containing protein (putative c-di-GMP-specific phosphodiesterase class I)